ncbi:MAG TPA: YoaK family protein [Mesorhizobium sp.]|jgi:uncharacterized membrane protein YoaK (UPF0700 family)
MIRLDKKLRFFAASLSFVAGFVDALGFIHLGGYFVSFMSGNSTRMAVSLSERPADGLLPLSLMGLFLAGVVGGTILSSRLNGRHGRVMLLSVSGLLAVTALLATLGLGRMAIWITPVAMGAMNTLFQRDGEVSVGVTYMTGTLVKLGQRLAAALTGGPRWAWAPYLLLWLGLMIGAICGAAAYPRFGLVALWLPVAILLALSGLSGQIDRANRG